MRNRKKKVETYECQHCAKLVEGSPRFAIIRFPMVKFCSNECLEAFVQAEKENKSHD